MLDFAAGRSSGRRCGACTRRGRMRMADSMERILNPGAAGEPPAGFAHAPPGWSPDGARARAAEEGLELTEEHWEAVRAIHEYCDRHPEGVNVRELHDALGERFHARGGPGRLLLLGRRVAVDLVAGRDARAGGVYDRDPHLSRRRQGRARRRGRGVRGRSPARGVTPGQRPLAARPTGCRARGSARPARRRRRSRRSR